MLDGEEEWQLKMLGEGGDVLLVLQRCSDDEWVSGRQARQDPINFPVMYNPDYCIHWDFYCDRN
jgi:hypothetical protein